MIENPALSACPAPAGLSCENLPGYILSKIGNGVFSLRFVELYVMSGEGQETDISQKKEHYKQLMEKSIGIYPETFITDFKNTPSEVEGMNCRPKDDPPLVETLICHPPIRRKPRSLERGGCHKERGWGTYPILINAKLYDYLIEFGVEP